MSSYLIELNNNVLRIRFNKDQPALGDEIVKDAVAQLDLLIEAGKLRGDLLLVDGSASVPVSYIIAHKVAHLYGAIAVCDPKLGDKGKKVYIVSISHTPKYQIGQLIETEELQQKSQKVRIALCGNLTELSYLSKGLEEAIKITDGGCYPQVISVEPNTIEKVVKWFQKPQNTITLLEFKNLLREEQTASLLSQATHGIILIKDEQEINDWKTLSQSKNLPIIAIIQYNPDAKEEQWETESSLFKIIVKELDEMISMTPWVKKLAATIVKLTKS